jgi:hypothetical protein
MQAVTRHGEVLEKGDSVKMVDCPTSQYVSFKNDELVIEEIKPVAHCESKFNLLVRHKPTGSIFKRWLDANWFTKK